MLMNLGARVLRLLPPETAHRCTLRLLSASTSFLPPPPVDDQRLSVRALGLQFSNPVGLAAGFDKNAEVADAILKLGFGFVECGTVTPRPQAGNTPPRLFRLAHSRAVINRMGFNNAGMEVIANRLSSRERQGILGLNIGANKDSLDRAADYLVAFTRLAPLANYIAVNVSSPNTPGLRALQGRSELERLLATLCDERARLNISIPLLLKVAPDLDEWAIDDIADVALASRIDGLIATNTTVERPQATSDALMREQGGLSGRPLFKQSTNILKAFGIRTAKKLVLVGAGGIGSGADAYAKIRAGASLVQLYTALVFDGPGLIARIKHDLLDLLVRDGFSNISQAIGIDSH